MLLSTRKFWSGIIPRPLHRREAGRGKRKGVGARPSFDLLPSSRRTSFALLATGKDNGADERHQQHQRGDLERRRPVAEERFARVPERHQGNLLRLARPLGGDGGEDRQAQEGAGGEGGERPLRTVERLRRVAHAGQHHREEDKDGDGAAVDQHLDDRQKLGRKQDEDAGDGQQGEDEEQRAVDDVAGEDDTESAEDGERRHEVEDQLFVAHGATVGDDNARSAPLRSPPWPPPPPPPPRALRLRSGQAWAPSRSGRSPSAHGTGPSAPPSWTAPPGGPGPP